MRQKLEWLVFIVITLALILGSLFIYHKYINPTTPVVIMPHSAATTPQGVQQASQASGYNLKPGQAAEIAQAIKDSKDKPPDEVTDNVAGKDVPKVAEEKAKAKGAQTSIITDPKNPDKAPDIKPEQKYTLNHYMIKSYPKQFVEITYNMSDTVGAMSYWRTKLPFTKEVAYVGVGVDVNTVHADKSKIKVGILIPIN